VSPFDELISEIQLVRGGGNMKRLTSWVLTLFTFCLWQANAQTTVSDAHRLNPPASAPVREVTDTYFGTKVVDPYRWMEDLQSAETVEWMKLQNDYARRVLNRLPMRDLFLKRLNELGNANVSISALRRIGNKYFYFKLAPGENDQKLYIREGLSGPEKLLVDPERLSIEGKRYSISDYNVSKDGEYVSYTIAAGGSELGELRVIEVATGRDLGERIDRVRLGAGSWLPDGRGFLYNRLQKLEANSPATEQFQKSRVYLHHLGAYPETDKPVFGYEVDPNLKVDPTLLPYVYLLADSGYAVATLSSFGSADTIYYTAPIASLAQSKIPWRKAADIADEVGWFDLHGDDLYFLTSKNTPHYKVVRTSAANPNFEKAQTVLPPSAAIVTRIEGARDALYVQLLDGGISKLLRVDFKSGRATPVILPFEGAITGLNVDPREPGIIINMRSWTKSPAYYFYDPARREITDTKLQPPSPVDFSRVEAVRVKVKSYDGTMVPLTILYKRGLKRDGKHRTLLEGYGAYGFSVNPVFNPVFIPWLEQGGVYAFPHIRGGGEYGREWHRAGFQKTKPNSWKDYLACVEYLEREGYSSPAYLAGSGGSAGAIVVGNAITERPDLFGAAFLNAGYVNVLRGETTSNGIANIPEFGSVKTEEGFRALRVMDAYQNVKDGIAYPSVLLSHGINDSRVPAWMSAKMAARLQAATSSDKPILLRIDYDAGHGVGSTRQQRNAEQADIYAFLFQQLGD